MKIIIDNIIFFTVFMMLIGFVAHQARLLGHLSKTKGRFISPVWYIRNRPYKLLSSWLMSVSATLIAYVGYDPTTAADNLRIATYLANVVAIGGGADYISDRMGQVTYKRNKHDEINYK